MLSWEEAAKIAIKKIVDKGFEAYIVGGAVRDMVLNQPVRDIDISTNATVKDLQQVFARTIDVGADHGTIIVPIGGRALEITQYRTNANEEATLHNDLYLRDFTCNAMAMDLSGKIIDPFEGQSAIANKLLKVVGGSSKRFLDDPLRLLRGVRFAILLQFSIEKDTEQWMIEYAPLIRKPAVERITAELSKIVDVGIKYEDLYFLGSHPVIQQLPYIFSGQSSLDSQRLLEDDSNVIRGVVEGWSFLTYSPSINETKRGLNHYKLSNHIKKDVLTVVERVRAIQQQHKWSNYDLYLLGNDGIRAAEKILSVLENRSANINILLSEYLNLPIKSKKELAINGGDLVNLFPDKPRQWIGETLTKIEKAIVSEKINNSKAEIYEWVIEGE